MEDSMTLRTRFESFFSKYRGAIGITCILIIGIGILLSLVVMAEMDKRNKAAKHTAAIQQVCDHEHPFSQAVVIGSSEYCETSSHVLYTVELRCGDDDPNCFVATRACKKIGFKNAVHIDNRILVCEDNEGNRFNTRL